MLPFRLCDKKRLAILHMNRCLFPTTLSIPSYDTGKQFGLRTYSNPRIVSFHISTFRRIGQKQIHVANEYRVKVAA